jgi:chitinase
LLPALKNKTLQYSLEFLLLLLGAVCVGLLSSCQAQNPTVAAPPPLNIETVETKPFRIIAYVTSSAVIETIPFDKLTHINYAFLIPEADGSLMAFPNAWKLDKLVKLAHKQDVKVLISVGGWGYDPEFESLAADDDSRTRLVENLTQFMGAHDLDGIDIDWEYPEQNAADNFLALMTDLRTALPEGALLTTAVAAAGSNGDGIHTDSFEVMDFVNLMVYDGPAERHATLEYAHDALTYWAGRGLAPKKTVIGIPFYGHPNHVPYSKLVKADPGAAHRDQSEYHSAIIYYNGIPTVQEKTRLAKDQASGVMFWLLEHDTQDETSLLNAIYETVR